MINQDDIIFGLLAFCVASVVGLSQSSHPILKRFFAIFPSVLLAYLIPSLLTTFGIIDVAHS